jgi:hypothetical protein
MQPKNAVAGLTAMLLLLPYTSSGQAPPKPEFEVASVKRNTTNGPSDMRGPRRSGDLITMRNTQLGSVIYYASVELRVLDARHGVNRQDVLLPL